jgi:hypothetical protein
MQSMGVTMNFSCGGRKVFVFFGTPPPPTMVSFLQYGANTKKFIPQMGSSYQNNLKNN